MLGTVEDQRLLAEHKVRSRALAVSEQRLVEVNREQFQIRARLQTWIRLCHLARRTNRSVTRAHAHMWGRTAGWQGLAHTIYAAWSRRTRINRLAVNAGEANWTLALELEELQIDTLSVVLAWVGCAAERLFTV